MSKFKQIQLSIKRMFKYYTPDISEVKIGFRYEQLILNEGWFEYFGHPEKGQEHYSYYVWEKQEVCPRYFKGLNDEINLGHYKKLIEEKRIRTSTVFCDQPVHSSKYRGKRECK